MAWLRLRPETRSSSVEHARPGHLGLVGYRVEFILAPVEQLAPPLGLTHLGAGRLEVPERPFFQAHDFFPPGPEFALLGGVVVVLSGTVVGAGPGTVRRYGEPTGASEGVRQAGWR